MRAMHSDSRAARTARRDLELAARIRALRRALGLSQAALAELVGVDQSNVSRWESGAIPDDPHIRRMAELAEVHPAQFRYGEAAVETDEHGSTRPAETVAVVGYVGAGQEVFSYDDHALGGGLEEVSAPEGVGEASIVAMRVRGDSMHPMRDGWLLFYRREDHGVSDDCLNRLCIVKVADEGPILVKELRRGYRANHFVLSSWNAPPIEDVRLDWAAPVLSIRPC